MDSELTSVETTAYHWLKKYFRFPPTEEQDLLFQDLKSFIEDQAEPKSTFLMMGYAGTGKTTIIQALDRKSVV